MSESLVSIIILTYNHENYIKSAIESCLMQKTSFPYEIIINDDASNDGTVSIIQDYFNQYPEIIIPIVHDENQYQKGIKGGIRMEKFILPLIRGKYIAYCEGDDYWIDPLKLQKQIEYMENHPGCSLCFHDAILVDEDGSYLKEFPGSYTRETGLKNINELTRIPTASKLIRNINIDYPEWHYKAPWGDFSNTLLYSNYGYVYYFNQKMSAYRTNVKSSAMYSLKQKTLDDPMIEINRLNLRIEELVNFNEWSNFKYDTWIQELLTETKFLLLFKKGRYKDIKNNYRSIFVKLGRVEKIKLFLRSYFPKLYHRFRKLKYKNKEIRLDYS